MSEKSHKNHRRKPKQARAVAKYQAVLNACTQVLLAKGYQQATILELSLESEVAVPTIYQYFDNKDAIFIAWIENVIDRILNVVVQEESKLAGKQIDLHIEVLIRSALTALSFYKPGLQQLIAETPNALSSKIIQAIESKTLEVLLTLFAENFSKDKEFYKKKTLILIRLITGYFLQTILNQHRDINIDQEANDIAMIVILFLTHHKMIH